MKRYKKLWDEFISMENIDLAAKKAVKSKKNKNSVKYFLHNRERLLKELQESLINGSFNTSRYKIRTIYEPKKRDIYILPLYPDHIVHHALINVVGPIWQSTFVKDSFACIPGKGLHRASLRTMDYMRKNKYVLQCDIRKFYPSIDHETIYKIIKKKIGDERLLSVLHNIIFSVGGDTNLPIGNLTSQWMGNVYLNEVDHFVKEVLHCKCYIRYCDDFLLFGNDKAQLHQWKDLLRDFIGKRLKLAFSKSAVYPTKRGVAFIGYRHFKNFLILRKYGAKKIRQNVCNIAKYHDRSEHAERQLAAYYGWTKWCKSYNYRMFLWKLVKRISYPMSRFFKKKYLDLGG